MVFTETITSQSEGYRIDIPPLAAYVEELSTQTPRLHRQLRRILDLTGHDLTKQSAWEIGNACQLSPKTVIQMLMTEYWLRTGVSVGDETTELLSPHKPDEIARRVHEIREENCEPWISCSTLDDPLWWQYEAKKTKLWKDIDGNKKYSTSWLQFIQELNAEISSRRNLVLKIFKQNPEYLILNMRTSLEKVFSDSAGWSLHVEWLETTDARQGDEVIPRSFLICTHPTLSIVCGRSTKPRATHFLETSLPRINEILKFWQWIGCPPATLEGMRQNGQLHFLNDILFELPPPEAGVSLQEHIATQRQLHSAPLYQPIDNFDVCKNLDQIRDARWVTPVLWEQFQTAYRSFPVDTFPNGRTTKDYEYIRARAKLAQELRHIEQQIIDAPAFFT